MSEDRSNNKRGWIDRLSDVFTGEPKDKTDLLAILQDCKNNHILNEDALGIIQGALEVQDTHVREIMIPRSQMLCLEFNDNIRSIIQEVAESAHSRYPVLSENGEDIVGILLAKDLLSLALKHQFQIDQIQSHLKDIMRDVFFVPESKRLNVLLKEFRNKRNHMAVVLDEYGSYSGLVTIEDILEEIVGEIEDEHDEEISFITANDQGFVVNALTPIDEFNDHFDSLLTSDEYETIGGLISHHFGHLPKRDEQINIGGLEFTVTHCDERRIKFLQVCRLVTTA